MQPLSAQAQPARKIYPSATQYIVVYPFYSVSNLGMRVIVLLNRFRALHLADQGLRSTDQGHGKHAMLRVQEYARPRSAANEQWRRCYCLKTDAVPHAR